MPLSTASNDASITERLFNQQTLNAIDAYGTSNHTKLIERSCPDSVVDIYGLPDTARIIIIAGFPETCRYFNGDGLACRGDFSIVDPSNKLVVHLEIKRTTKSGVREQLLGSSALISYFKSLADKKLSEHHYLEGYEERYITIGYTSCDVRNSSGRKISGSGTSPDDIMRISYPGRLNYRTLI